jgi:hypothetical protein
MLLLFSRLPPPEKVCRASKAQILPIVLVLFARWLRFSLFEAIWQRKGIWIASRTHLLLVEAIRTSSTRRCVRAMKLVRLLLACPRSHPLRPSRTRAISLFLHLEIGSLRPCNNCHFVRRSFFGAVFLPADDHRRSDCSRSRMQLQRPVLQRYRQSYSRSRELL